MVNRGRPSRDCAPCKRRKLKCDLVKPQCGQCRRARISCPGSTEASAFVFRDETSRTKTRVVANTANSNPLSGRVDQSHLLQARSLFFAHYVCGAKDRNDILQQLFRQASADSTLTLSVDAVSLGFAAQRFRNVNLLKAATDKYAKAVKSLKTALNSSEDVVTDGTLQAILMLDIYEKVASKSKTSELRLAHSNAAQALVTMRGSKGLQSYTGRRLVPRLLSCWIVTYGLLEERVPDEIRDFVKECGSYLPIDNVNWASVEPVMDLLEFYGDAIQGRFESDDAVIRRGFELAAPSGEMEKYFPPPPLRATRVDLKEPSPLVFENHYDLYADFHAARTANKFRVMRAHFFTMWITHYSPASEAITPQEHEEHKVQLDTYLRDMCASAPQFILPGLYPGNTIPFSAEQILRIYSLLGVLWVAGSSTRDEKMRDWVQFLLRYIADTGGMEAAAEMADRLGDKRHYRDIAYWWGYTMVGSYAFVACGPGALMRS